MKEIKITYSELMKDLDRFRIGSKSNKSLTKEQVKFLLNCREDKNKGSVPFSKMAEFWQQLGWGKTSENSMRRLYKNYKDGNIEVIDCKKK